MAVCSGPCGRTVESNEPSSFRPAGGRRSAVDAAKRSAEAASLFRLHHSRALFPTAVFPSRQEFLVIKDSWPATKWETQTSVDAITLSTSRLKVVVARKDSSVTFQDSAGKTLFVQNEVSMTPAVVNGEQTYHAELYSKLWGSYESFY